MPPNISTPLEPKQYYYAFRSDPKTVHIVPKKVLVDLRDAGLTDDQKMSVEILLTEVINNIIEHAYQFEIDQPISLILEHQQKALALQFIDHGVSTTSGKLPVQLPVVEFGNLQNLPEGGFGWNLIRNLSEDISFARNDKKNLLSLTIPLG